MQELVTDDVEIVPFRYALEDTIYRGRDGLHQWLDDVQETWEELHIELGDVDTRVAGVEYVEGRIVGRGVESHALTETAAAWVSELHEGRVRMVRTFIDLDAARAAFEELLSRFE